VATQGRYLPCHREERSDVAIQGRYLPCHREERSDVATQGRYLPCHREERSNVAIQGRYLPCHREERSDVAISNSHRELTIKIGIARPFQGLAMAIPAFFFPVIAGLSVCLPRYLLAKCPGGLTNYILRYIL